MKTKIELTENAEMLVDANVQLPNAAKNVLGALIYTRGAYTEYRGKNDDWFYKDADSLIKESQVSKPTFFRAINLLETNNFIERKSGSLKNGENKVTQYKVLKGIKIISNDTLNDTTEYQKQINDTNEYQKPFNDTLNDTNEYQKPFNDTLNDTNEYQKPFNDTLEDTLMIHKNKESSIKNKEKSIKNKDIEKIYNKINNIIEKEKLEEKDFFEIIKKFEGKFNFNLIPNNTENTKNAMDTNIELQLKVSKLEAKLNQTSNKDKTEAIQDSSTSSKSTSTVGTSTKQDKSDSKPSNGSSLPTTHKDEEKPTESDSKASTPIAEDVDADAEYGLFTSAVEACEANNIPYDGFTLLNFKNMILQDLSKKNASYRVRKEVEDRIDKFIQDFNEKNVLKPSNEQSGIVAHQEDLKPTEGKETASTSISEDNATSSNDVDDSLDGIIISGKSSKKDEVKHSREESDSKEDSKELKDLKMPKTVEGCFQRYLESVEDLTNPTKVDLNWRKDCITQSCKIEGFDESFIQELKSKIDKYNEEKALKVEDSSKDEEDESFREDTVSIQGESSTTNEKPSSGITTPKDEEKLTEGKEMPLNGNELRYLDRKTGKQYATEAEAQKNGADPMFLYDNKDGRCVFSYTSPVSTSNEQGGIVAHQDDLKLVEAKKMPSMAIVDSYADAQKEIEDSMEGDLVSEPSLAIAV